MGLKWFGISMTDTFGLNQFAPKISNMSSKRDPPMTDFSLRQAKRERQTSNDQASAPVANDGNDGNNNGENGNGKQRGNRLPRATETSNAMATNNGDDGGCVNGNTRDGQREQESRRKMGGSTN